MLVLIEGSQILLLLFSGCSSNIAVSGQVQPQHHDRLIAENGEQTNYSTSSKQKMMLQKYTAVLKAKIKAEKKTHKHLFKPTNDKQRFAIMIFKVIRWNILSFPMSLS